MKNAIVLTLRMILVTIIGLYTSRVVLEALGVDDYGIYGVVGGVVSMASFLNSSMAGATSRFITFAIGKDDMEKLKKIFATSLWIHFFIAIVVVILAETIGLWFLNHKMQIPSDRIFAANVLFQLSVASVIVGFTQVPYTADIIAHEKMDIYAYFEIVNVVLKLTIVYLLLIVSSDRLIFYASMVFAVSVLRTLFYRWYCIRKFPEAHFSSKFNRETAKEMLSFSSYDLYGNMCAISKRQGEPIVLNLFFGVVANAGASIALTVCGTINGLTGAITQAFRPQIIKQYAAGDITNMSSVMRRSAIFSIFAFSAISIPFIIETPRILYLWLGQIPTYSVEFLRLIILISLFDIIICVNNVAIHATGDIRRISFINGTFYLLVPIVAYCLLKFIALNACTVYIVDAIFMFIVLIVSLFIINKQIKAYPIAEYFISIFRGFAASGISIAIVFLIKSWISELYDCPLSSSIFSSLLYCLFISLLSIIILTVTSLTVSFNAAERQIAINKLKNTLYKAFSLLNYRYR